MNCPRCGRKIETTAGCLCHLETPPHHMSLPIRGVYVLSTFSMKEDRVVFIFHLPDPEGKDFLKMEFNAPKNQGDKYVRETFGIECEVKG